MKINSEIYKSIYNRTIHSYQKWHFIDIHILSGLEKFVIEGAFTQKDAKYIRILPHIYLVLNVVNKLILNMDFVIHMLESIVKENSIIEKSWLSKLRICFSKLFQKFCSSFHPSYQNLLGQMKYSQIVILRRMKGKEIVHPSCPSYPSKFRTSLLFFLFFLPIDILIYLQVYSIQIAYILYIIHIAQDGLRFFFLEFLFLLEQLG